MDARRLTLLVALPLLPLAALGCDLIKGKTTGRGASDGGGSSAPAGSSLTGKAGGPKKGGYVVVTSPEPRTLNPIYSAAFNAAEPLIFEGLVGLDSRTEPVPVLAEKWERSADGKLLTFTLRKDVSWHDGKPFSSA